MIDDDEFIVHTMESMDSNESDVGSDSDNSDDSFELFEFFISNSWKKQYKSFLRQYTIFPRLLIDSSSFITLTLTFSASN
jgi:hypothetical protein